MTRWLTHPRFGIHLVILAVVLALPALWLGWQLDDHTYRLLLTGGGDGDVLEARFEFAVPLEDASLRWVRWEGGGYVPFTPPAAGRSIELRAARGVTDLLR